MFEFTESSDFEAPSLLDLKCPNCGEYIIQKQRTSVDVEMYQKKANLYINCPNCNEIIKIYIPNLKHSAMKFTIKDEYIL